MSASGSAQTFSADGYPSGALPTQMTVAQTGHQYYAYLDKALNSFSLRDVPRDKRHPDREWFAVKVAVYDAVRMLSSFHGAPRFYASFPLIPRRFYARFLTIPKF